MNRNRFLVNDTATLDRILDLLLLGLFGNQDAFGKVDTGSISGTVRDTSEAVIPGATALAKNNATSVERTVQTGPDGGYTIPALPPGTYQVNISRSNFQTYETKADVTAGAYVPVAAQLSLSSQITTIEVEGRGRYGSKYPDAGSLLDSDAWGPVDRHHKIGSSGVGSIEYNGAHGVHLYDIRNINELGGGQIFAC